MTSGKQPDYNPTVALENTSEIPVGALLEAAVGRENVLAVSGAPTTSDGFPTSGRIAVDTSTDPDTYYVGDGSTWQTVETWAELQATVGGVGTPHNPDTADLGGSDTEVTASGAPKSVYVLRVDDTSSASNLQGVTGDVAVEGTTLIIMGANGGQTNTVTIEDNNGSATDPFQNPGDENRDINEASDVAIYRYAEGNWRYVSSNLNPSLEDRGTTASNSPGFGSWTTVSSSRPALVTVEADVETNGTSAGEAAIEVDEDGGTTADYTLTFADIEADAADGTSDTGTVTVFVPAGGQYQINNVSDPKSNNSVENVREVTL